MRNKATANTTTMSANQFTFPSDPRELLRRAIVAVFASWNNPRAVSYRSINKIQGLLGTAVTVQAQVFGNMSKKNSGTGVLFTRNPSTGEPEVTGEWLPNAQGEDVVAGIRDPLKLPELAKTMPKVHEELIQSVKALESHFRDMQDVEFTVQHGTLYILQTRDGKRTGAAALRIAKDLEKEGLITREHAIEKLLTCKHIESLLHPQFRQQNPEEYKHNLLATGIAASPGAAVGRIVFTAEDAEHWFKTLGEQVILVRSETSAEDVSGMFSSNGILTTHGGMTSHAAVVARGWGKPCVCGCGDLVMSTRTKTMTSRRTGEIFKEGDWISINGTTGEVVKGKLDLVPPIVSPEFQDFIFSARSLSDLKVYANADRGEDVLQAVAFGAQGIGLVRTEHTFYGEPRIRFMQRMILAQTPEARAEALDLIFPYQREDFKAIFRAAAAKPKTALEVTTPKMGSGGNGKTFATSSSSTATTTSALSFTSVSLATTSENASYERRPVTIRLLDPPLHEYLPRDPTAIAALAQVMELDVGKVNAIIKSMRESNPMLGHRGCRVEITHPEIPRMQTKAILTAAIDVCREAAAAAESSSSSSPGSSSLSSASSSSSPSPVEVEIMIPLISTAQELEYIRGIIEDEAQAVMKREGMQIHYKIGNMLETPRAALVANEIAKVSDFFSVGSNDLTSLTFGFSRDDAPKFIPRYLSESIITRPAAATTTTTTTTTRSEEMMMMSSKPILAQDPFQHLDLDGVGELIKIAIARGRMSSPDLPVGVCGEVGGDEQSIEAFSRMGINYVSCSPFRVPVAILAAAQSSLRMKRENREKLVRGGITMQKGEVSGGAGEVGVANCVKITGGGQSDI